MTRDSSFKKVVRRHAHDTGQPYTEALTDLEGLEARLFHKPVAERLLAHLRDHYRIDAIGATKASRHNDHVFRIERRDGDPWIARVFPPARPKAGVEGDAAILRYLERQGYPAERLAVDDAVSAVDGACVLVTQFINGRLLPSPAVGAEGIEKFAIMGNLLGRLHALPFDESVSRPGGASGEDPSREGSPRQDLLAALSFLDAVDTKVTPAGRERFDQLRDQVRAADDGHGLPGVAARQPPPCPGSRHRERAWAGGDPVEGGGAGPAPRRLCLADVGHLAQRRLDRRGRKRISPARRVDRRRTPAAGGGDVRATAVSGLFQLPGVIWSTAATPRKCGASLTPSTSAQLPPRREPHGAECSQGEST